MQFLRYFGHDLPVVVLSRVIVAFLAVVVLDLDYDDLRFLRLGDVEQLVPMVVAVCEYLVLRDALEVQDFTKVLDFLENVVSAAGVALGTIVFQPCMDSVDLLVVARILLRDLSQVTHDVGYQELLALLIEIGVEKLNLVALVDEEVLLVVLPFLICIIITDVEFLDRDLRIF